jgi:hypothetical protein
MLSSLTQEGLDLTDLRGTGQLLRQAADASLSPSKAPEIDPTTIHQMLGNKAHVSIVV